MPVAFDGTTFHQLGAAVAVSETTVLQIDRLPDVAVSPREFPGKPEGTARVYLCTSDMEPAEKLRRLNQSLSAAGTLVQ